MKLRKIAAPVVVAAAIVASAACGGDDSPGDDPSSPAGETGEPAGAAGLPEGWEVVTDEKSGLAVGLPESVEPQEQSGQGMDGSTIPIRAYIVELDDGVVGFSVYETPPDQYSLQVGAGGVAQALGGTLASSEEIEVDGFSGLQGEVTFGENLALFQLVPLDEVVWQALSAGPADDRERIESDLRSIVESAELN